MGDLQLTQETEEEGPVFFFWGGVLSLATLHSRPAHAAGFSLGMHRASCDPGCENQIDVSHYRSQWYPFNGTGGEAARLRQICSFLRVLCSLQPLVPLYADSDMCNADEHRLKSFRPDIKEAVIVIFHHIKASEGLKVKL